MIVVGFPILIILVLLVVFGVTWLFQHHHLRPFAGFVLLVIGLGFLWIFAARHAAQPLTIAPRSVQPAQPVWEDDHGRVTPEVQTGTEPSIVREYKSNERKATGTPASAPQVSVAIKTAEKQAERTLNATDDNPAVSAGETKHGDKKPNWVGQPLHRSEYDGQQVSLADAASGPYSTTDECERAIIPAINEIVGRYVRKDDRLAELSDTDLALDRNYIRENLVKQWYTESVEASVGQMYQLHALIVFDDRIERELESRARIAKVAGRLGGAAAATAITLLVLAGVYSVLKRGTSRPTTAAT